MSEINDRRTAEPSRRWVMLVLVGAIGGLLSGLFGVGGGIIMVPLLVLLTSMDQRRAAATSLAAIIPAALVGSLSYLAQGEVDLLAGLYVSIGAVVGALLGTALLKRISLPWLRWMFIVLLLLVAVRMLLVTPARDEGIELGVGVAFGLVGLGLVMGVASGLFGIGGGVIAVPALVILFGASDLIAKGTSLLVMIPTSVAGTLSNVRGRAVDLRSALVVGAAATVASFGGVALAFLISPLVSSILFGVLLLAAAAQLTVKALRARR